MEEYADKVARYLNGLKYSLQDELCLTSLGIVEECYQLAIKEEEKLKRRQEKQSRGRGRKNFRGRGTFAGRGQSQRFQGETSNSQEQTSYSGGNFRGRRPNLISRFSNRGGSSGFTGKCYKCNKFVGHQAWQCTEEQPSTSYKS